MSTQTDEGRRTEEIVVGVVIPLFKHSVLIADAVSALVAQRAEFRFVVVIVNDGCPFADSMTQVEALRSLRPDLIRVVARPNGGLSAARNTGIDFLLRNFPSLKAIYFLDSDNLLRPTALARAYRALREHGDASWIYPNIDMYGVRRNYDYCGPYLPLRHLIQNICEAGSLVHRRVFDDGIRFDESMRLGFEDWDFWLSAMARGHRGLHEPMFGFRYRHRGESMLTHSKRATEIIAAHMRAKHETIMAPRALLELEARTAPRFVIFLVDINRVVFGLDALDLTAALPLEDAEQALWRALFAPSASHFPPYFLFSTSLAVRRLAEDGLLSWVGFEAEKALREKNFVGFKFEACDGPSIEVSPGGVIGDCSVFAVRQYLIRGLILDKTSTWLIKLLSEPNEVGVAVQTIRFSKVRFRPVAPSLLVCLGFMSQIQKWRDSPYASSLALRWIWRQPCLPTQELHLEMRRLFEGATLFCPPRTGRRNIGFVLRVASFGGVERVAHNVARELTALGAAVHLFLIGARDLTLPSEFRGVYASISFLDAEGPVEWDFDSQYLGTNLPSTFDSNAAIHRLVAALSWLDVVVNHHSGALNAAAGALRRHGVVTATYQHVVDETPARRQHGHPMLALAFEHGYDYVICVSEQLKRWMHASGVPADKLTHVPNAPGHRLARTKQNSVLEARETRSGTSLRALYLGRLDRQKGVDRLAEIVSGSLDLGVRWRIVGETVTDEAADQAPLPQILCRFKEPAVFDDDALVEIMAWADVMVLMSDYEGSPLSILEALRLGVIVIATNVGALSESIRSGENGFLVEPGEAARQTLGILRDLTIDAPLRRRIAREAIHVRTWEDSVRPLAAIFGLRSPEDAPPADEEPSFPSLRPPVREAEAPRPKVAVAPSAKMRRATVIPPLDPTRDAVTAR